MAVIVIAVTAALAIATVVWLARNAWVYRVRIAILHADYQAYRSLPTYGAMMARFWIWDASRFVGWEPSHAAVEEAEIARAAMRGRIILSRAKRVPR